MLDMSLQIESYELQFAERAQNAVFIIVFKNESEGIKLQF